MPVTDTVHVRADWDGADLERGTRRAERDMKQLNRAVVAAGRAFAAIGTIAAARQLVQYADTWTNISNRLRLVTKNHADLAAVQDKVFRLAQDTRQPLEATADLYSRIARNAQNLRLNQEQLLQITRTINQAMVISGASAASAQAALVQLGQAFASGTLRGEELNSVLEQAPRLAEAIATGMGRTIGELRALGAQGRLTAKAVTDALISQAGAVEQEFGTMQVTAEQGFTAVTNAFVRMVGQINTATRATQTLAGAFNRVADVIEAITDSPIWRFMSMPYAGPSIFGGFGIRNLGQVAPLTGLTGFPTVPLPTPATPPGAAPVLRGAAVEVTAARTYGAVDALLQPIEDLNTGLSDFGRNLDLDIELTRRQNVAEAQAIQNKRERMIAVLQLEQAEQRVRFRSEGATQVQLEQLAQVHMAEQRLAEQRFDAAEAAREAALADRDLARQHRRTEQDYRNIMFNLEDTTARALLGMQGSFSNFFEFLRLEIIRQTIRRAVTEPIFSWLFPNGNMAQFHHGGVVPGTGNRNVPAMLQPGEVVFTKKQAEALGNVRPVNVYMTIQTSDAGSFQQAQTQISRGLASELERAGRQ